MLGLSSELDIGGLIFMLVVAILLLALGVRTWLVGVAVDVEATSVYVVQYLRTHVVAFQDILDFRVDSV